MVEYVLRLVQNALVMVIIDLIFLKPFWGGPHRYKFDCITAANSVAHTLYSFPEGCKPSVAIKDGSVAAILVDGVISI